MKGRYGENDGGPGTQGSKITRAFMCYSEGPDLEEMGQGRLSGGPTRRHQSKQENPPVFEF